MPDDIDPDNIPAPVAPGAGLLNPAERTDVALGGRFAHHFGYIAKHVAPWKGWITWDGRRWARDGGEVTLASILAADVWKDIQLTEAVGKADCDALTAFGRHAASKKGAQSAMYFAAARAECRAEPSWFNQRPTLLNAANGVIDLETGRLMYHSPELLLTAITEVPYIPTATCPTWERTVSQIFAGDDAMIGFFRRTLGMAMLGEPRDELLPCWVGAGSNGKSMLIEVLLHVFGEHGTKVPAVLLMQSKRADSHPTVRTMLFGKRIALLSETAEDASFDNGALKELCGRDTISARGMNENYWQFRPTHTLFLATNHRPHTGDDAAVWRRLRLIPFHVRFWQRDKGESGPPELEANKQLTGLLLRENSGILAWLVRACLEYLRDGLGQPPAVTMATEDYREDEDFNELWFDECCTIHTSYETAGALAQQCYRRWCDANGRPPQWGNAFAKWLAGKPGIVRVKRGGIYYENLLLRETVWQGQQSTLKRSMTHPGIRSGGGQ